MKRHESAWIALHNEYFRRREELLMWFIDERNKLRAQHERDNEQGAIS